MFGERLTDFLNGQERFRLHKVAFEASRTATRSRGLISVEREDLLAVVGDGSARVGEAARAARRDRMQLSIGPYMVLGRLHGAARPGPDAGRPPARADGPVDLARPSPTTWPGRSWPATSRPSSSTASSSTGSAPPPTRRRCSPRRRPLAVHDESAEGLHGLGALVLSAARSRQSATVCAPVRRCAPRWRVRVSEKRASIGTRRGAGDLETRYSR